MSSGLQASLLDDLADRGLLGSLAFLNDTPRECPLHGLRSTSELFEHDDSAVPQADYTDAIR